MLLNLYEIQGKKRKRQWWKVLVVIIGIIEGLCIAQAVSGGGESNFLRPGKPAAAIQSEYSRNRCHQVAKSHYDCTDELTKQKAKEITHWYAKAETIQASVTQYTAQESCHYPDSKGRGCLTASGTIATIGRTAARPKRFKFGTEITILGHAYVCEDRTAVYIQDKYGDTFDLFVAEYQEALRFGRRRLEVTVKH